MSEVGSRPNHPGRLARRFTSGVDFEDTFISYDLSDRGIDISALYHSSFQDYNTYQGNKYHKDKNTLVRMGGHTRGPPSLGFTESRAKYCALSLTLPAP